MKKSIFQLQISSFCLKALAAAGLLIFLSAGIAQAQSGRRPVPKPKTTVEETAPPPEPKPAPQPKPTIKPDYSLIVVSYVSLDSYRRFAFPDRMHRWVADRLKSSPLLEVQIGSAKNRREARDLAKNSSDAYVVYLELNADPFGAASADNISNSDVWIDFTVMSPGTGKIKQSGRAYSNRNYAGRGGILNERRLCYPDVGGRDYYLLEASWEAAERIMSGFKLPIPAMNCSPAF
jgi:hypothetical protein